MTKNPAPTASAEESYTSINLLEDHMEQTTTPRIEFDETELVPGIMLSVRKLLVALLERAILDYVGSVHDQYLHAGEWINDVEADPLEDQWSFAWVCEQLNLQPDVMRAQIVSLPRKPTYPPEIVPRRPYRRRVRQFQPSL